MTAGAAVLTFADAETVGDLRTFVSRARKADPDGAIRLVAHGDVLAAYVSPVHGAGAPTVLGLRTMRLATAPGADVTVALAAVADRLAAADAGLLLPLPPVEAAVPWAGVSPPRAGWQPVGSVQVSELQAVARAGIQEIASGAGEGSGAHAVARLRGLVWSRPFSEFGVPSGAAFAAEALAFAHGEDAVAVYTAGRWTRLTTARGHVLAREPLGAGLV